MANPTTNYGFVLPTPTDLVTDLPADFDVALQGVDTQMLTNANAAIAKTIVDAKGDIIAATAADAVSRLAVGANNTVLTADSTTATGIKWAAAAAASGAVVQVKSTTFSTSTTNGSATYADTGLTLDITPTSASNKILIFINQNTRTNNTAAVYENSSFFRINRGSTAIYYTDLSVWYINNTTSTNGGDFRFLSTMIFLDSPATTSATTYKTQQRMYAGSITSQPFSASSSITLMEVTP